MTHDFWFGIIIGMSFGGAMTMLTLVYIAVTTSKKYAAEKEEKDPANWWKCGESPPEYGTEDD